jgi:fructose-1,6-bisphosphatase I / sedoheptulose-1,7-bisphosphatase
MEAGDSPMLTDRSTLTEFLIDERRRHPGATGELNALVLEVALACKAIAARAAYGALGRQLARGADAMQSSRTRRELPAAAHDLFVEATEWGGHVAGIASKGRAIPIEAKSERPPGRYLLVFDALDGSSNIDINAPVGSLFSILRSTRPGELATPTDYLQAGSRQVCAGYAIYGPSTMLVLSVGTGTHGFTLEPQLGEFILTHQGLTISEMTNELAIDASNSRLWEPAVKRYVDECLAGGSGVRGKDFNMRWVASLVAETHRILIRGGVFLDPYTTSGRGARNGLRLLHEANPVSFIVEQAGGVSSTARERVLNIEPTKLDHRVGLVLGAREEIERIEAYHRDYNLCDYDAPLFGVRGLFRGSG